MYSSVFTASGDNTWNYSANKSTEDVKREISMILPKDREQWITEGSSKGDFFFKKSKLKLKYQKRSTRENVAKLPISSPQSKVAFKFTDDTKRAASSLDRRQNSVILPLLSKRPKSLPKIIISGGFTISQQTLLEIRELFFYYSVGQEFITLDCNVYVKKR